MKLIEEYNAKVGKENLSQIFPLPSVHKGL